MGKYDPLRDYLLTQPSRIKKLVLSIEQVEVIINAQLPATARSEGVFWANVNRTRQSPQSAAWLKAGWTATEDVGNVQVAFRRGLERLRS